MGGSHTDIAHLTWCFSPSIGNCNGIRRLSGAGTGVNRVDTRVGLGNRLGAPQTKEQEDRAAPSTTKLKGMHTTMWSRQQENAGKQSEDLSTHVGMGEALLILSC